VEVVGARPQRLAVGGRQRDRQRERSRAHGVGGRGRRAVGRRKLQVWAAERSARKRGRPADMSKRKKKVSRAWLAQHVDDPYVKLAQKHGYRSRAAFKLIEIDAQDRLIRPGIAVVDLGSAPGAWSQVLRERLARPAGAGIDGRIVALDLLPMEPIPDVTFLQGDFREDGTLRLLEQALGGAKLDLVVSDMAPNLSGIAVADA